MLDAGPVAREAAGARRDLHTQVVLDEVGEVILSEVPTAEVRFFEEPGDDKVGVR